MTREGGRSHKPGDNRWSKSNWRDGGGGVWGGAVEGGDSVKFRQSASSGHWFSPYLGVHALLRKSKGRTDAISPANWGQRVIRPTRVTFIDCTNLAKQQEEERSPGRKENAKVNRLCKGKVAILSLGDLNTGGGIRPCEEIRAVSLGEA